MQDLIGYDEIIESAMRNVINQILKKVETHGLQGGHYFVISFSTSYPGIIMPEYLRMKFPEEMTIVIQHQFENFKVEDSMFKISLSFSGIFENLLIPYRAITSFADPFMNFGLRFSSYHNESEAIEDETAQSNNKSEENVVNSSSDLSQKVISLDAFRKNKNNNKNKKD